VRILLVVLPGGAELGPTSAHSNISCLHCCGGPVRVVRRGTRCDVADEDLIDDPLPFESPKRSEVELIDHLFGFKAGAAGESYDETKSLAWQRGWADAKK
jgi:hypothetical protein